MLTNKIKRTRAKLALFEQEGLNELLFDLLELVKPEDADFDWKQQTITDLQRGYKKFLTENTPADPKQQKLDL